MILLRCDENNEVKMFCQQIRKILIANELNGTEDNKLDFKDEEGKMAYRLLKQYTRCPLESGSNINF